MTLHSGFINPNIAQKAVFYSTIMALDQTYYIYNSFTSSRTLFTIDLIVASKVVMFSGAFICLPVCLFVCVSECSKINNHIFTKFFFVFRA